MTDETIRLGMQKEGMLEPPPSEPDAAAREWKVCCDTSDFLVREKKESPKPHVPG